MTSTEYINLSFSEKKKIIKSVIQAINKEQRDLVERHRNILLKR